MNSNNFIEIINLNKSFNETCVFKNFSIKIPLKSTTVLKSKSGKGKTTLLKILMGLEKMDSGVINGLENLKISTVFQENRLCENLSAIGNILLVNPRIDRNLIKEYFEDIGLINCYDKPIYQLSGGMQRRVSILRSLLFEHDLLLLDEPFKGLDIDNKLKVISKINKLCHEKTIIIVTHDTDEIEYMNAKNIINLD